MKDQSVVALLESGEIQMTEDVLFMLDKISEFLDRGMNSDTGGQFVGYAVQLIEVWREALANADSDTQLADEVIANIVAGKTV